MRLVSVFANGPDGEIERLRAALRGQRRQAPRAVMVILPLHGLSVAQFAVLLDWHPPQCGAGSAGSTAEGWRRWLTDHGAGGLQRGGRRLTSRIAALLARPGTWTLRGSGGTWAGRRSGRAPCNAGSGWWRSGGSPG
jgi:hypothetical protein